MQQIYELKLADGRQARWLGTDAENAARRYIDTIRPGSAVVATRPIRHGLFFGTPTDV
jgi:hypothetical protein